MHANKSTHVHMWMYTSHCSKTFHFWSKSEWGWDGIYQQMDPIYMVHRYLYMYVCFYRYAALVHVDVTWRRFHTSPTFKEPMSTRMELDIQTSGALCTRMYSVCIQGILSWKLDIVLFCLQMLCSEHCCKHTPTESMRSSLLLVSWNLY